MKLSFLCVNCYFHAASMVYIGYFIFEQHLSVRVYSFFQFFVQSSSRGFAYCLSMYIFRRGEIEVCIFRSNQCNQIFSISNLIKNQISTKNWRKIWFIFYLIKTQLNFVTLLGAPGWLDIVNIENISVRVSQSLSVVRCKIQMSDKTTCLW